MKFWIVLSFIALQLYVANGFPQFHLPFSKFPDFVMPDAPEFEKNFQMPEADMRMSLPSFDENKTNKTTSKKKLKGNFYTKFLLVF